MQNRALQEIDEEIQTIDMIPLRLPIAMPEHLREFLRTYCREFGANAAEMEQLTGEYAWEINEDGQTAGYLWVQRFHGNLYFSTAVFPEFQRRGFGSEARWRTEQFVAEQGVQMLFAQVNTNSPETGHPSRKSLLRSGYSLVPEETLGLAADADERIVLRHPAPIQFRKDLGLTSAEHREAQELAFQFAIERGGGSIPPYDFAQVVEDFCRAAGEIIRQRRRPARAGT